MRDDKDKKIGSATYLNKSNGKYIPFGVFMTGVYCPLIQSICISFFAVKTAATFDFAHQLCLIALIINESLI